MPSKLSSLTVLLLTAICITFAAVILNVRSRRNVDRSMPRSLGPALCDAVPAPEARATKQQLLTLLSGFTADILAAEKQLWLELAPNATHLGLKLTGSISGKEDSMEIYKGGAKDFLRQLETVPNARTVYLQMAMDMFLQVFGKNIFAPHSNNFPLWIEKRKNNTQMDYPLNYSSDTSSYHFSCQTDGNSETIDLKNRLTTVLKFEDDSETSGIVTFGFLHVVRDVFITRNGDYVTGSHAVLLDDCLIYYKELDWRVTEMKKSSVDSVHDRVFSIAQTHGLTYYHLTAEHAARLSLFIPFLVANPDVKIHLWSLKSGHLVLPLLQSVGITEDRIVTGNVIARMGFIPPGTPCGHVAFAPINAFSVLARAPLDNFQPFKARQDTVVLIKRSKTRWLDNNDAIFEMIKQEAAAYQLNVVEFKDNPPPKFEEQRETFHRAVMVVAPHGAGLSNILYCKPGTCVIEAVCCQNTRFALFELNAWFERMSSFLGHMYHAVVSPRHEKHNDCFDITAEELRPSVKSCLKFRMRHA
eukprot:Selendium_serpulae@DN6507_c1_g1_i7.p1